MYGLEGILGNLVTSVATPAIGGLAGDFITKEVVDNTMPQLLKEMTQTTVGALSGAAVGAGLGAITGGKSGAISGALTGGVGGGLGGYHAPEISQMFGMGQTPPQGVGASQGSQPQPPQGGQAPPPAQPSITDQLWQQNMLQRTQSPIEKMSVGAVSPGAVGLGSADQASMFNTTAAQPVNQPIKVPTQTPSQTPAATPSEYKGYTDFLKQNYEPLAGGFFLGSAYGASQDTQEQSTQNQQNKMLEDMLKQQQARRLSRSTWGKAEGGPVEVGLADPQISVHFPAWAQEDIQREGGLAALQPGIRHGMAGGGSIEERVSPYQSSIDRKAAEAVQRQEAAEGRALSGSEKRDIYDSTRTRILNDAELGLGYVAPSAGLGSHISGLQKKATGGYINLQPMGEEAHPQALIPRAQPYAAATPQRREVVQDQDDYYARGGLIDGEGDGMSDDIDANIEGRESVKVADGEYVIPRDVAHKYGPEKLKRAMAKIRAAAHAKKGKQIVQGAAQRALIQSLTGVRA